ncbi:MAG: hypothetical protein KGZ88_11790 [Methylomicrobium sp.]|nr:hypothetical protein [Methylomicrobium sp.]
MITLDALELPKDLVWVDEFDWTPVQQSETYTLTGALVLESGVKQAGRTITLSGTDSGWADRALIKSLYAKLTDTPPLTLTLHDSRVFTVAFNQQRPIEAKPIVDFNDPDDTDYYTLTLRFIAL